ncbi:hypothetical protein CEP52_003871 [Fusarium oligoseptatum]|uniref:Uncharacterized protein n=1 Tax=Fusarium oligoseptatum TaxID=2604345 RepID=A0A428U6C8_9HYPO|nr:hypothetical protein CEP52_003871 [Fusarium oligoseptatum]
MPASQVAERKRMSQHMAQYFDDEQELEQSLNEALESLENDEPALDASENTHAVDDIDTLLAGPFGVFQLESSLLLATHETDIVQPTSAEADSIFDERVQVTLGGVDRTSSGSGHALPSLIVDTSTCIAPREVLESVIAEDGQLGLGSPQSEVWSGPVRPRGIIPKRVTLLLTMQSLDPSKHLISKIFSQANLMFLNSILDLPRHNPQKIVSQ